MGLDCVLEGPKRYRLGVNKMGLECVLEGPRRSMLGVHQTGLERALELIHAWRRWNRGGGDPGTGTGEKAVRQTAVKEG